MQISAPVYSDKDSLEIEHLLKAVGTSNCIFIRNGKEHSAIDAEDHLRMKYRKGKKYVDTTEQFIERIASKSSFSGDAYYIHCVDKKEPTSIWLSKKLAEYRHAE